MARPMREGLEYFPHDTDASSDEKVEALTSLYGAEGYAFYFILLERIYRTAEFKISVRDEESRAILARKCLTSPERFDAMIKTAVRVGCFDADPYREEGILTSSGIRKRSFPVVEKRDAMRKKYAKNPMDGVSASETLQKPDKAKESKVKESREELLREVLSRWNEFASKNGLSPVMKISTKREAGIIARSKEIEFQFDLILQEIESSDFLLGKKDGGSWRVDFDFIFLSANNYLKILEGKYRNANNGTGRRSSPGDRGSFRRDPSSVARDLAELEASIGTLRSGGSERSRSRPE